MKNVRLVVPTLLCLLATTAMGAALRDEIEVERSYLSASKKDLVAQAMALDEATSAKFWPLYNEYQEALRPLGDRKVKLITDFAENYQNLPEPQAKQLTDEHLKIQEDLITLQKKYVGKFRKMFPDTLVARYFQVENKINSVINFGLAKEIPLVQKP